MHRSSSGFTLIELIAIMVITGILGTSVVSTYSNYNKWLNINEELQAMTRRLQNARDYCMGKGEPFHFSINTDNESYTLQFKSSPSALILPGENANTFTMPSYIDFTSVNGFSSGSLEFNILGEPTTNTNAVININNGDQTITIVAPTGYIYAQ